MNTSSEWRVKCQRESAEIAAFKDAARAAILDRSLCRFAASGRWAGHAARIDILRVGGASHLQAPAAAAAAALAATHPGNHHNY